MCAKKRCDRECSKKEMSSTREEIKTLGGIVNKKEGNQPTKEVPEERRTNGKNVGNEELQGKKKTNGPPEGEVPTEIQQIKKNGQKCQRTKGRNGKKINLATGGVRGCSKAGVIPERERKKDEKKNKKKIQR